VSSGARFGTLVIARARGRSSAGWSADGAGVGVAAGDAGFADPFVSAAYRLGRRWP
jgi:hypothetical protein